MRTICAAVLGLAILSGAGLAPAATPARPAPAAPKPADEKLPIGIQKWTGDLDEMVKRRRIRVLVIFSRTQYFVDKGRQHGTPYEAVRAFEDRFNTKRNTEHLKVHVVFIPVSRDELIPALLDGRGDIAAGRAHHHAGAAEAGRLHGARPARASTRSWSRARTHPTLASVDDLSGKEVFARAPPATGSTWRG